MSLCLTGGLPVLRGLLVFPAQLVAGIASAGVVSALFPGPLNVSTRLGGGTSISQGLFIEMFLTAQLVFVVIMLAVVKHKSTYLAPVGIGVTFFVAEMIGTSEPAQQDPTPFLTLSRRLLHRWIPQPRAIAGPRRDQPQLPRVPLDLLGRAPSRLAAGVGILPAAVFCPVGEYQSGAGL